MGSLPSPILYLIRHGEKPPKLPDGDDQIGLDAEGLQRAQDLVQVFAKDSPNNYNIGYIIAQHPHKHGKEARPYLTIKPLADSLGVPFNTDIERDDSNGVASAIRGFQGPGNILVCWEHGQLTDILEALGVPNAPEYPDNRFDIIWTLTAPYTKIDSWTSEHCPGLDDAFANDP